MAKPYDAAGKHLIEDRPRDWLMQAGFAVPTDPAGVTIVDADLSAVTAASDKLIRVDGVEMPYLGHLELQTSYDPKFDRRVLMYNAQAGLRHDRDVRSAAFLLRRAAATGVTGRVQVDWPDGHRHTFTYPVVKVWTLSTEALLAGPIGTLPLAPLSAVALSDVPSVLDRMTRRIRDELPKPAGDDIITATGVLMGLTYSKTLAKAFMATIHDFSESWVYQEILEKGVVRGRTEGRNEARSEGLAALRDVIFRIGTARLGPPPQSVIDRLNSVQDPAVLDDVAVAAATASDWDQLTPEPFSK